MAKKPLRRMTDRLDDQAAATPTPKTTKKTTTPKATKPTTPKTTKPGTGH